MNRKIINLLMSPAGDLIEQSILIGANKIELPGGVVVDTATKSVIENGEQALLHPVFFGVIENIRLELKARQLA